VNYSQPLSGAFAVIIEEFYKVGKSAAKIDVAEANLQESGEHSRGIAAGEEVIAERLPAYQQAQAWLASVSGTGKNSLMLTAIIGGALVLAIVVLSKNKGAQHDRHHAR